MATRKIVMNFTFRRIITAAALTALIIIMPACKKEENNKPTVAPPVRVTVMEAAGADIDHSRVYSATVATSSTTTLSFSVPGTITGLYASEGQLVSKGQLLGSVKSGEYENASNIAHAQLEEAQDGYERLKKLHDANALPDVKWVEMEQKLKQAQNAAQIADRTLQDTKLHAPISGTINKKFAQEGETVIAVQPIYEIISTEALNVEVPVSENEIGNFHQGMKAFISFNSENVPSMEGRITQKTLTADPLTRTYTVKIAVNSNKGKVLPGMTANVKFEKSMQNDSVSIVLPSKAVLLNEDNRLFVWVVKNGVAERKFVTADELSSRGIIIKAGLNPGDSVIVEGMQKVGSGTKVIPVNK